MKCQSSSSKFFDKRLKNVWLYATKIIDPINAESRLLSVSKQDIRDFFYFCYNLIWLHNLLFSQNWITVFTSTMSANLSTFTRFVQTFSKFSFKWVKTMMDVTNALIIQNLNFNLVQCYIKTTFYTELSGCLSIFIRSF